MPAEDVNTPGVLTQAIREDARRQADALITWAREQATAVLAQATAEVERTRQERLHAAQVEAARRTAAMQASISVVTGRLRATRIDALLQSLYDAARQRLVARQGYDYHETLVALVTEAAQQMGDTPVLVRLSPADRAAIADRLAPFTLVEDPTITEGGAIVLDADGRRVWDNRLFARLDRLWPELRRQIVVQGSLE
jgi:vacuolar-type H+-ATPase subunit E/Vma4